MKLASILAAALALAGCGYPSTPPALSPVTRPAGPATGALPAPPEQRQPVTILVSIDGFRPDYLHRGDTPTLDAAAAEGVSAAMRPSFPTLTFPNHQTLVTGLRPDRHGIVSNTMEDVTRPGVQFQISDPKVSHDAFWWDGAEPLWVTAERAGIPTATMFWPGSEVAIRDVRPSIWIPYDAAITSAQRVRFVLDWLRRPAPERPRFLTLYFDVVDKRSHNQGFFSPEKTAAIREVDAAMLQLRQGLAALGQPANLVIVSDHGMAPVPPANRIPLSSAINTSRMRAIVEGPLLYVFALPGQPSPVAIAGRHGHYTCWTRETLPKRFAYGRNPRVSPVLCLAEIGWRFMRDDAKVDDYIRGDHGFDPADPAMRAAFIATGPAFARGRRLPTFDNVDVAPLLRDLIGLPADPALDGTDRPFRSVLAR